jgi:cytidine and deoxycytidylate deaminase zinc-binding region
MNEVHTFALYAMQEALQEAQRAFDEDEVPIGAVITQQEKIIARAHNQTQALHDPTAHAEMLAITAACNALGSYNLARCTLYVSVEPCPMCASALQWAQIGAVYYGAKDTKRGYSLYSPNLLHPRTTVKSGVMQEEAVALLQLFFQKKRNPT